MYKLEITPRGWGCSEIPDHWFRDDHLYRGMTEAEYLATVGAGLGIQSDLSYSFSVEGTSFADNPYDAESYVNFGRDDPRVTGKPNFLVETKMHDGAVQDTDGYWKAKEVVPQELVTRVFVMQDGGEENIVAGEIEVPRHRANPEMRKNLFFEGDWKRFHEEDKDVDLYFGMDAHAAQALNWKIPDQWSPLPMHLYVSEVSKNPAIEWDSFADIVVGFKVNDGDFLDLSDVPQPMSGDDWTQYFADEFGLPIAVHQMDEDRELYALDLYYDDSITVTHADYDNHSEPNDLPELLEYLDYDGAIIYSPRIDEEYKGDGERGYIYMLNSNKLIASPGVWMLG